jgi:hypothetical protein
MENCGKRLTNTNGKRLYSVNIGNGLDTAFYSRPFIVARSATALHKWDGSTYYLTKFFNNQAGSVKPYLLAWFYRMIWAVAPMVFSGATRNNHYVIPTIINK